MSAKNLNDIRSDTGEIDEGKCSFRLASASVTPISTLCRFFVLGKCRYGSRCTFSHTLPANVTECGSDEAASLSAAAALVNCQFYLRGNCKFGEYCRLRHDPMMLAGASGASCYAARAEMAVSTTSRDDNQQDFTCGICFDDIVQSGKYFGLLSCDHCFCLNCLRSWRQSKEMELVRACPACRIPSDYIVPSLVFCIGDDKHRVVEAYKSHLALRECKYFNGLLGSCPFGPRCFYAHQDAEGRDVKHLDRPKRSARPPRRGRSSHGRDGSLQSLLQEYSHFLRFFEAGDWDDFDLVGDLHDSENSDEDYFELGFPDNAYDIE
ncbi:hypothetical protein PsorP6_000066 [Peronosclerospora sorghi]|uniref:Uncharacterized protein n=1 Tax=Peronosclerospora sorghi TaxID=230839 RepID=A0ACC0WRB5_9STRA|nr:hypothetical protein PsorP6_000066 [Peronosclerospora sorghi]